MRKLLSLGFLFVLFLSCDEGVVITSPTSRTFEFVLTDNEVNSDPNNEVVRERLVDVNQFFTEEGGQIESVKLDELKYTISGYNNTSGDVVLMDLKMETRINNGDPNPILQLTGLVVENTGEVIAFEDGNPESVLSAAQVASLESIMDNLEPFDIIVTATFSQNIDSGLTVAITWGITASISQDTTGG